MKEKYIDQRFGIFYDGAGSLFYNYSGDEKEVDVSKMEEEDIKIIVQKHKDVLNELKKYIWTLEAIEEAIKERNDDFFSK